VMEVFRWLPGTMPEGYMYNLTGWSYDQGNDELSVSFTIPTYYDAGDYGLRIYFFNGGEEPTKELTIEAGFTVAEVDIGFAVVPWTVSKGGDVMMAVLVHGVTGPVSGAEVAIEIYNETWHLIDVVPASEVASGIYVATYTVPSDAGAGWWTAKAVVTVAGREAVAYQGFMVTE
ncbi:MAG: hypothetical protein DRJ69_07325, partial [Thermoprotei archaeon]